MIAFRQPYDRLCAPRTDDGMFAEAAYERVTQPADICERKHGGNLASVAANESAENVKRWHHANILDLIGKRPVGLTAKEYVDWLNDHHDRNDGEPWVLNQVSGRFSELAKANEIRVDRAKGRREGCGVWILADGIEIPKSA